MIRTSECGWCKPYWRNKFTNCGLALCIRMLKGELSGDFLDRPKCHQVGFLGVGFPGLSKAWACMAMSAFSPSSSHTANKPRARRMPAVSSKVGSEASPIKVNMPCSRQDSSQGFSSSCSTTTTSVSWRRKRVARSSPLRLSPQMMTCPLNRESWIVRT